MRDHEIAMGVLIDEAQLTVAELARACQVEPQWVLVRVQAGLLGRGSPSPEAQRFSSAELIRARRLLSVEQDFEANAEVAALVVDLIEEVHRLREGLR